MTKITEAREITTAVSRIRSFRLGWHDGVDARAGRDLASATDKKAYARGVDRGGRFRQGISANRPGRGVEAAEAGGADEALLAAALTDRTYQIISHAIDE